MSNSAENIKHYEFFSIEFVNMTLYRIPLVIQRANIFESTFR